MTFNCWTQNPTGPRHSCKTWAEVEVWAARQNRDESCGYVLAQGRKGREFLPMQIYNIGKRRWSV